MVYSIPEGEDIFSTVINLYGSLELYARFIQDNSGNLIAGDGKGIVPISVQDGVDLNDEWIPNPSSDAVFNPGVSFVFMGGNDSDDFVTLSPTNVPALFYTANQYIINWNVNFSDLLNQTLFIELVFENSVSVTETTMQGAGTTTVLQDPSWGALIEVAVGIHGDHSESVTVTSFSITGVNTVSINEAIYDPALYVSDPLQLTQSDVIPSTIKTLSAQEGQTIYDLCAMTYGGLENIYKLISDNAIDSINKTDLQQTVFTYDTTFISDNFVYSNQQRKGIIINTGTGGVYFKGYLLQQDYFYILQQSGFKIILT